MRTHMTVIYVQISENAATRHVAGSMDGHCSAHSPDRRAALSCADLDDLFSHRVLCYTGERVRLTLSQELALWTHWWGTDD